MARGCYSACETGARCTAGAQNRLLNDYVDERGCLWWGGHAVRSPLRSGVPCSPGHSSSPMGSEHLRPLGPAGRSTGQSLQGKQEVAMPLPDAPTLRSPQACLKLGGVCQRVEAGGQEEGLPPTRLVVLWLALSCTLSLSLN